MTNATGKSDKVTTESIRYTTKKFYVTSTYAIFIEIAEARVIKNT